MGLAVVAGAVVATVAVDGVVVAAVDGRRVRRADGVGFDNVGPVTTVIPLPTPGLLEVPEVSMLSNGLTVNKSGKSGVSEYS